ncbi:MAG: chromosome segregation protein SMC, partial [Ignavibacteriales bacterium]|nr:chromosome segregation protein SMC [Ignavibacteriales bacterium]
KDKIAFLQQVIDNLEGFSKGAKALLEDGSWHRGEKNLLANIGNAEDQFRFAIEASMKSNLNSIIVDTMADIQSGIQYLEQNDFGKAAFYLNRSQTVKKQTLLQKLSNYFEQRKRKKLAIEEGFLGWADMLVASEEKWKPFFSVLLANTAVVKDLETALRFSEAYEGIAFTTLNGDYLAANGLIEGGAAPKLDETLFGRRQMLENLKADIPTHEGNLDNIYARITALETAIASIDMKMLADKSRMLVNDLANIEKQIAQFEFEKKKAIDDIEKNRQELQDIVTQSNELDKEREKLETSLETFREDVNKAKAQTAELETGFRQAESDYSSVVTRLNALHISIERLAGEKKNLENAITRNEENIVTVTNSTERRKRDIENANEEKRTLAEILEDKDIELHELQMQREKLQSEEKIVSVQYGETKNIIQVSEKQINELRKQRELLSNEIHAAEIKLNEVNLRVENLKNHIQENYSIQLELKEFEDIETFDFKQRSDEVFSLKQQIKNLGPVYMLAHSEYEEEKQRLEFLLQQRNDLVNSEKDLVRTIDEINTAAQLLFMETFEKIRGYFIDIFRSLFNPGDEADLRLEENSDPLEGKIEIVAKPKGKRPTSIELLSGGEKTLTAIALLFSIYLVKPSPFCILDEIDAPLDDANIDRFTKIIREFSKNTQFIVVTHNKRTMEASDGLYGVTMQEEGISKLVTVRFNEDMNIVA